MTDTKRCSKCGEVKALDEFCKDKNRKDGYFVYCRQCVSDKRKKYTQEHADELRVKRAAYRQANLERIRANERLRVIDKQKTKERQEKYRARHKDVIAEKHRRYREANLAKVRETQRLSTAKAFASNPEKFRAACRAWHKNNPENAAKRSRKKVDGLSDGYVASAMRVKVSDATTELLALKREQLAIKRMTRELKKAITNQPKGEPK